MKSVPIILSVLFFSACAHQSSAQTEAAPVPSAAQSETAIEAAGLALLKYHEGMWDARWDWVDPEGKPLGTLTGTEEYRTVGDGYTQHMISTVNEMDQVTHSLITFNVFKEEILFFSSGDKGDYWIMRQDPVTGIMVSDPHVDAEGKELIIRFTMLEKEKNSNIIQMESSSDGGQTWTVGFHQHNTRRT